MGKQITKNPKSGQAQGVSITDVLADKKAANREQLKGDTVLLNIYDVQHSLGMPLDLDNKMLFSNDDVITADGDTLPTADTIMFVLTNLRNEVTGAACYTPNTEHKRPLLLNTLSTGVFILGSNNYDGDVWVSDDLEHATMLYAIANDNERPNTVAVIVNPSTRYKSIREMAKERNVKMFVAAHEKDQLIQNLQGADVDLYVHIDPFTALSSHTLNELKNDCIEVVNAQELSIPHAGGFIECRSDGLYHVRYKEGKQDGEPLKICGLLEVLGRSRDIHSQSWGKVLKWRDADNKIHNLALPDKRLQGDTRDYRAELTDKGLYISTEKRAHDALNVYLNKHPTKQRVLCVDKLGWYGDAYVMPEKTLGGNIEQPIVYQPEWFIESVYSSKGTLQQWRDELSSKIADQSRIAFAVSCAFAGQLLRLVGADGGGFHMRGGSSMGKSIGLRVAGSVWGNPEQFIGSWRATDNAIEGRATIANDSFLGLDEINEGDPKAIGKTSYMLANGKPKGRGKASGGNRKEVSWRLIFLSNGEMTLNDYLGAAGIKVKAGQEVRLVNIEADAGKGYGSFDKVNLADTAEAQANIINKLSSTYYGVAGVAWLDYLTKDKQAASTKARSLEQQFMTHYADAKSQAHRVATRFALVAAAGEMATEAGITGWQSGQATAAAMACLDDWLDINGRDGNREARQIIESLQTFIAKNGSSRFQPWSYNSENEPRIINRIGWRKAEADEYYFYPNTFGEACGSHSIKTVLSALDDAGLLVKKQADRNTCKVTLPDSKERVGMYLIKGSILNYETIKSK